MDPKRRVALGIASGAGAMLASVTLVTRWWPALTVADAYFWYWLFVPLFLVGVVAVALGALVISLVAKRKRPTLSAKARTLASLCVMNVVMFAAVFAVGQLVHGPLPTGSRARRFDSLAWRTSPPYMIDDITPRQKMLADVVQHVLPGKTREEIESALGHSEETSYFEETGRDLIYMTGPERDAVFGIDSEWLLIWLDKNGRFERYDVRRD